MKIKNLLLIISIFFCLTNFSLSKEVIIKVKIDDQIITNIDIYNEISYLNFLNPSTKKLSAIDLSKIGKNSLIREIIKKKELKKYFDLNKNYKFIDKIESDLIRNKNLKNKNNFVQYLEANNLNYFQIREKLKIEALWNQLIYDKYNKNVKIDKKILKDKIIVEIENLKKKFEYNLSEILYEEKLNENNESMYVTIKKSIENIGFENTANLHSISDSSKNGGVIGWVKDIQISKNIINEINNLQIGEFTEPIKIPSGYIVIKLNTKKEIKNKIDVENELSNLIEFEKSKQLNSFSIIFYKRLKKNTVINEY